MQHHKNGTRSLPSDCCHFCCGYKTISMKSRPPYLCGLNHKTSCPGHKIFISSAFFKILFQKFPEKATWVCSQGDWP